MQAKGWVLFRVLLNRFQGGVVRINSAIFCLRVISNGYSVLQ